MDTMKDGLGGKAKRDTSDIFVSRPKKSGKCENPAVEPVGIQSVTTGAGLKTNPFGNRPEKSGDI